MGVKNLALYTRGSIPALAQQACAREKREVNNQVTSRSEWRVKSSSSMLPGRNHFWWRRSMLFIEEMRSASWWRAAAKASIEAASL